MAKSRVFSPLADGGGADVNGISDVPGLQAALDSKAALSHTHTGSDISGGVPTFTNVYGTVYTITDGVSVLLNPANGRYQTWTLAANRTPTASFASGQSMTLMVDDGASFTINWASVGVTWLNGSPPTLQSSGFTHIDLWKVGSTIFGAYGAASGSNLADNTYGEIIVSGSGTTFTINPASTPTIKNITSGVFTITDGVIVDINPNNGAIQTWTIAGNRSPTASSFAAGQSILMHVARSGSFNVTWPSVTWTGGSAPTIPASGSVQLVLYKIGSTLYGTRVGDVA